MGWTNYQFFLTGLLVVTGSINTLSTKWADRMVSEGKDGKSRKFDHPFIQACSMFLGEFMCLLVFKCLYFYFWRKHDGSHDENKLVKGSRSFNPFVFLLPALCDMIATSTMYVGLTLTYASSFQMLRGAVIVFVGIFSILFLRRKLVLTEWCGIIIIICGLALVGLSDFTVHPDNHDSNSTLTIIATTPAPPPSLSTNKIIIGDLLIIAAQIVAAIQMVLEEKFVSGLDVPPLQAVGWEGLFGFTILGLLLIPFYFIYVPFADNSRGSLEDALEAFIQMSHNKFIIIAVLGTVISIAFFNFAGISVTKEISATTRMVLDSVRTLIIWAVSLALHWQAFHWLQVAGFVILLIGMVVYNNIPIMGPIYKVAGWCKCRETEATGALINDVENE